MPADAGGTEQRNVENISVVLGVGTLLIDLRVMTTTCSDKTACCDIVVSECAPIGLKEPLSSLAENVPHSTKLLESYYNNKMQQRFMYLSESSSPGPRCQSLARRSGCSNKPVALSHMSEASIRNAQKDVVEH